MAHDTDIATRVAEALGIDRSDDAALNLEGAIDTLVISGGMTEEDTVVRTMRRVLGQIEAVAGIVRPDAS